MEMIRNFHSIFQMSRRNLTSLLYIKISRNTSFNIDNYTHTHKIHTHTHTHTLNINYQ